MNKKKFLILFLSIALIFVPACKVDVNSNYIFKQKNNYMNFDEIDHNGVSDEIVRECKNIWDKLDDLIDKTHSEKLDDLENMNVYIANYIVDLSRSLDDVLKITNNNRDNVFVLLVFEHIKKKMEINGLGSIAKLLQ